MTEEEIKKQLVVHEPFYTLFKDEVVVFLDDIKKKHSESIEIYSIGGRIKTSDSIFGKISQSKGKYSRLADVQDIAGTRVVCHCRSDLDRLDAVLSEQLKTIDPNFKKTTHDREDGYRGIHYILEKKYEIGGKKEPLLCEIQIRTVTSGCMGHTISCIRIQEKN